MNPYYFISKRINRVDRDSFSFLVTQIARYSIAIGLAVMLISFSILEGFKKTIQDKIFSFGAHIQITKYDISNSFEESPLPINSELYTNPALVPELDHIQVFSLKPALLK